MIKISPLLLLSALLSAGALLSATAEDCGEPEPPVEATVFFSEYVEGNAWDKAVELYNPTDAAVDLSGYALWRGSNGAPFPGAVLALDGWSLEPGATLVIAHSAANEVIRSRADLLSDWANFNGDDALGLAREGVLIDTLGEAGTLPAVGWAVAGVPEATQDQVLIRKAGILGGSVIWAESAGTGEEDSQWTVASLGGWRTLGEHPHGDEGMACYSASQCVPGLDCAGKPQYVEETLPGCCVDNRAQPLTYLCEEDAQCGEGFLCIGETCSPLWMADTFTATPSAAIPDGGTLEDTIMVSCLASVPVDGTVSVRVEHADPSSLTITLVDPSRDVTTPIFDRGVVEGTTLVLEDVPVRASGDDAVNGPWTLSIVDHSAGGDGALVSWSLSLTSRYD